MRDMQVMIRQDSKRSSLIFPSGKVLLPVRLSLDVGADRKPSKELCVVQERRAKVYFYMLSGSFYVFGPCPPLLWVPCPCQRWVSILCQLNGK